MQPTQKLSKVLRELVGLLEDEAAHNPAFAARLESITAELPARSGRRARKSNRTANILALPDVLAVFQEKGPEEFGFWLRSLDLPTLKAIIKRNGFDPAKASRRWTEPDKFIALIAEQTPARLKRGSAFLTPKSEPAPPGGGGTG